jgi:hypothetical protein
MLISLPFSEKVSLSIPLLRAHLMPFLLHFSLTLPLRHHAIGVA